MRPLVLIAALAAAVVILLLTRGGSQAPDTPMATTPEGSNYYLLEAQVRQFNSAGEPAYRIRAASSLHFPDESARLTDIRVDYPLDVDRAWTLLADEGRIPAGSRDVRLSGDVTANHNGAGRQDWTITTPWLWIRADQEQAETDAEIVGTAPGRRVSARGMRLRFNAESLTLRNDVEVRYQP